MAEKIGEALWKAFSKKHGLTTLDDKDLLKALARYDKTDARKPEPRIEALEDLAKQIPKQVTALAKLKKELGDKTFTLVKDELYRLLDEAETQLKTVQASQQGEEEEEEDEDSEAAALLNPKVLLRQLTMCRQDPERTVNFAFVDAKGDQAAMLAVHPRKTARKLFAKLQAASGTKTGAFGSAWVDGTTLMLQLDKPMSGLVKKIRPAVKASGFRIAKAVIWNADGSVFEQEDEEAGEHANEHANEPTADVTKEEPVAPGTAFKARMGALVPQLKEARAAGKPGALEATAKATEAGMAAGKGDFTLANALLDQSEDLLTGRTAPPAPTQTTSTPTGEDAPPKGVVAFQKSRILWAAVRQGMLGETQRLADRIVEQAAGEPDADELRAAAAEIVRIVGTIDERLQKVLDEITVSAEGRERESLKLEAMGVIDDYRQTLAGGLFQSIDRNPVLPVAVAEPARMALAAISRTLAQASAS